MFQSALRALRALHTDATAAGAKIYRALIVRKLRLKLSTDSTIRYDTLRYAMIRYDTLATCYLTIPVIVDTYMVYLYSTL